MKGKSLCFSLKENLKPQRIRYFFFLYRIFLRAGGFYGGLLTSFLYMVTICQLCGDKGLSEALMYCYKCRDAALHCYCLDVLPATFKEHVIWFCEDCEPKVNKPSTTYNPVSIVHKARDSENSETVEAARSGTRLKKHKAVNGLKNKQEQDVCVSLSKSEVHGGGNSHRDDLIEMHCSENRKKYQKFIKRHGEPEGSSSNEEAGSLKTKTSWTAIGNYNSNLEEMDSSERDGNKEKLTSPSEIPLLDFHDHKQMISQVLCSQNDNKEDCEYRRQKGLVRGSSNGEIESVKIKTSQGASNPSNIPKQSSHVHAKSIVEVQCNENADSGRGKPSNIPKHGCYVPAQLIMQPIWNGSLSLSSKKYTTVGGLVAHLSSLACYNVFEEAKLLPGLLCLDLLSRSFVWPKSFEKFGPSDDSIALYLFPNNERDERVYNSLVNDMISQDLAMRASVKNADLLIFTSRILPFYFWKFPAKFYLWGVFKGKQASPLPNTIVPGDVTVRRTCINRSDNAYK